jgi:RNA polymerase sigma-70 factor (ECF subfamily)
MTDSASLQRAELTACLHRVSIGERAALDQLYKQTSAKLFGICKRILVEQTASEDVLQEIYLIVWKKAGQFDPSHGVSPITWLAAIARNRSLDRLRAGKTRFTGLDEAAEIADTRPLADASLEKIERDARLKSCMGGLEPRAGGAIRDAFFGGLTYQSLAERAKIPLATMKSIIRRGLIQLKACLENG